ncbi:MAG TPA: uroporphyrinogen decarboxylase [Acidimicrobiia bacterium]|nr:uroporphyrinogen decarboxylase [Acidimicrobiia bacterium]
MRLLDALDRQPLDRPPIWFMRQAGRYLPEYRELRANHSFEEAMSTPEIAAEITLQPLRRFPLDAAIVFSDIMTPLMGMGVGIEFKPGPKLTPMTVDQVADLDPLDADTVGFVGETIERVRGAVASDVAVIGFAGGPVTLLTYLLEGGGSKQFPRFRAGLHEPRIEEALSVLATSTRLYLEAQVDAGADVVQLFDSWAGLLSESVFRRLAVPAARHILAGLSVPTLYFVPAGSHLLETLAEVEASGYGVDWRLPLDAAWKRIGEDRVIQGNLDPGVLLSTPPVVRAAAQQVLTEAAGRPGHIFNLGHGILPDTPLENVEAMVESVVAAGESHSIDDERTIAS